MKNTTTKKLIKELLAMGCSYRNEETIDLGPLDAATVASALNKHGFVASKVRRGRYSHKNNPMESFLFDMRMGFLQVLSL